jgi:hypothetical protein
MTAPLPVQTRSFLLVCALAGGLAVPVHAVASPVSATIAGLLGLLGLRVWRWSGLPDSIRAEAPGGFARFVQPALWLGLGLMVGLVLLAVIRLVIEPGLPAAGARIAAAGALPLWRRAAIIYVAAVGEEILFRLLLLSFIAGVGVRLLRPADGAANPGIVWGATLLSALAFAAVHLPAWSAAGTLTAGLALMVLTLNGLGGLVFGYLFVKRGIVAAMWAHAGADCAIQLIGPLTR